MTSWTAASSMGPRARDVALVLVAFAVLVPGAVAGQTSDRAEMEGVRYRNARDGARLSARLALPRGPGPHPGIVVLSIAGTEPLVGRLLDDGYAVLVPERRGFTSVEPLLRATYADLAGDVEAAVTFLRANERVDAASLGVVAQAEDTPPAVLAAIGASVPFPLVLLAPPAFHGVETFRREQRWAAEQAGYGAEDLRALDTYVQRIAETVLGERESYIRRYRLESVRAASPVELPRSAAFPSDDRQMDFFASALWHDRLAFDPGSALARLRSPVLVLIGADDANTPMAEYLTAVRTALVSAATRDAGVCRLPGRTRHVFTDDGVAVITSWLGARLGSSDHSSGPGRASEPDLTPPLVGCLADDSEG